MDAINLRKWSGAAAIVVMALAVLFSRYLTPPLPATGDIRLTTVKNGSLDISVRTVGVLDAARTHMVSSSIRGDKGKIIELVEDGTAVSKDDVLVRLDPTPFEVEVHRLGGEVRSLEAAVESARQLLAWEKNQMDRENRTAAFNRTVAALELRRLVDGDGPLQLSQYQSELDQQRDAFERQQAYIADLERLSAEGFTNATEIVLARKKVVDLETQFETARQRYESYKTHVLPTLIEAARAKNEKAASDVEQIRRGGEFQVARATAALAEVQGKLDAARMALKKALDELAKTTIRAPFEGISILYEAFRDGVTRRPRVGDRVWQNQPLLYLPDISAMIVKTRVREVDLHKVALAQRCAVHVDAYPDTHFEGRVSAIGMLATERFENGLGDKYFQMTVMLSGEDRRLRPGMTARIVIEAGETTDALLVPIHAVFDDDTGPYCYRLDRRGMYHRQAVVIGNQNEDFVEIVSGLAAGDRVSLLRPPADRMELSATPAKAP